MEFLNQNLNESIEHQSAGSSPTADSVDTNSLASNDADVDTCLHACVENGICTACDLLIQEISNSKYEFSNKHQKNSKTTLNFQKDLELIGEELPTPIKEWVISAATSGKKTIHRMGCRKQVLYAYIYLAYVSLGYDIIDPKKLMAIVKLDKKDLGNAIKYICGTGKHKLPLSPADSISLSYIIIPPEMFLFEHLQLLGPQFEHYYDELEAFENQLLENNNSLYNEDPYLISKSIIKYFFEIKEIKIDVSKNNSFFGDISISAIKNCIKNKLKSPTSTPKKREKYVQHS